MFEKLTLTKMARDLAGHAGARMGVIARNVANADTPGFKSMDLPSFAEVYRDPGQQMRATNSRHINATSQGFEAMVRPSNGASAPNGNSVSLETEMVASAAVRRDHDMALAIFRSTSSIIRTSLGRS
ncbi:MAG: FlgB family protein [Microgenomates group bacterium]